MAARKLLLLEREKLMAGKTRMATSMANVWPARRYQSQWRFSGMPLVCIALGPDPLRGEVRGVAKGWIAMGDIAFGGVAAIGGVAAAPIAIGGSAVGLFALGGAACGVVAFGGISLAWAACGGLAVAWKFAVGGLAMAPDGAIGGLAIARIWTLGGLAFAQHANDAVALAAVENHPILGHVMRLLPYAGWLSLVAVPSLVVVLRRLRRIPA